MIVPNLFTEAYESTVLCIMVFAMADVRRLASQGELVSGAQQVLNLPLAGPQLHSILRDNKDAVKGKVRSNEYRTVDYILQEYPASSELVEAAELHHLGDDKAQEECVYGITTDSKRQTVNLCFRGSITVQDWLTDAKMISSEIPNPLLDENHQDQPETLGVHLGFRNYLYEDAPSILPESLQQTGQRILDLAQPDVENKVKKKSKLDTILGQVEALLAQNPSYTLYITGHSLGGALASLAALEAAVRFGEKGRPVTCVAVANPRVGDTRFRAAIQTLEREGRLRYLAVHNHLDLVPLQPDRLFRLGLFRPLEFVQQGMQLTLAKRSFNIYHHGGRASRWAELRRKTKHILILVLCWIRMAEQHNYREYLDRLMAQKEELSKLYLNDLYKQEKIDF